MPFASYSEAVRYLYDSLPMYQRVGAVAYRKDLHNTIHLCGALGNPQNSFKTVHVAGTNGKGSSSHMIASVLQEAGYTTGLYTSPHLKSFTERIRVGGAEITKEAVVEFVNRMLPVLQEVKPSFFETTVAMAFDYFRHRKVDIAVIEVGLGGRLDSTNVITPEVALITNIGWDHMDLLGDTLSLIAREKAGIIKQGVPTVISERQPETEEVFRVRAAELGSPLYFATERFQVIQQADGTFRIWDGGRQLFDGLNVALKGSYQTHNIGGVFMTLQVLRGRGFTIDERAIQSGLEKVIENTKLKGRWQILGRNPLIVCDTAHNVEGMREVIGQLSATPKEQLHIVLGTVRDKDVAALLRLLPQNAHYYFCQARIPRALPAPDLASMAGGMGLSGGIHKSVAEAVEAARSQATGNDVVFIGGSTFVVAEVDGL
jgi:dihydrofolate synthase/folylpolyglutamate synthase